MGLVGNRLKQLRIDKGLYPSEVAKFLEITRPAYLKYENGQTEHPRKLDKLAAFFGVSTDYLLGRTDDPTPPEVPYQSAYVKGLLLFEKYPKLKEAIQILEESEESVTLVHAAKGLSEEDLKLLTDVANSMKKKHNIE